MAIYARLDTSKLVLSTQLTHSLTHLIVQAVDEQLEEGIARAVVGQPTLHRHAQRTRLQEPISTRQSLQRSGKEEETPVLRRHYRR